MRDQANVQSTHLLPRLHIQSGPRKSHRHVLQNRIKGLHHSNILNSHVIAVTSARINRIIDAREMADADISARAKSKRKRESALLEPEDVTADILDELQRSRKGIDKKLAKYNDAIMQIQVRERQQFIEKCATRIRNLHDSVRPIVVVQLLSSEDFAVEMNFSELHTSSSKSQSLLTWSCTDGTLSESSWKTGEPSEYGDNANI